jgi:hypothetical protein
MDREARAGRYHGRSVVELYNTVRPHASLGYKPPAPEVFVPAVKFKVAGNLAGCILCKRFNKRAWRAQQRSTPWRRDRR